MTEKSPIEESRSCPWLAAFGMALIVAVGCAVVVSVLHNPPIVAFYGALAVVVVLTPLMYATVVRPWVARRGSMCGLHLRRVSADSAAERRR